MQFLIFSTSGGSTGTIAFRDVRPKVLVRPSMNILKVSCIARHMVACSPASLPARSADICRSPVLLSAGPADGLTMITGFGSGPCPGPDPDPGRLASRIQQDPVLHPGFNETKMMSTCQWNAVTPLVLHSGLLLREHRRASPGGYRVRHWD